MNQVAFDACVDAIELQRYPWSSWVDFLPDYQLFDVQLSEELQFVLNHLSWLDYVCGQATKIIERRDIPVVCIFHHKENKTPKGISHISDIERDTIRRALSVITSASQKQYREIMGHVVIQKAKEKEDP